MELSVSPQTQKMNLQTPRKSSLSGSRKDLWFAIREGSLVDVDSALTTLKKSGGNINLRNAYGLTPLHIAIWRNHIPIISRLLAAGADPDAKDGESGWSSLHRALHFGHLTVASVLIESGASFTLEDIKLQTPVDLVSGPIAQVIGEQ
ncbi:PREDICTED: palmitoyltransferase ZDHHC13-like [Camelina sativa]|uniref:Palmitoyltransferase ZDHHC13-like n=1 Tax=Camelina sativa TaxID=90675 RepID=A0ABM1QDI5_CAMSA|nr:PREDICTED: palmitoyltransferase ZDHHC13-like [Camelina sativa]